MINGRNILRFIKAQRLRWFGHISRMDENRMPKIVFKEKLHSRRKKGRPRIRWEDEVRDDLRRMGCRAWRGMVGDRDVWRAVVEEAKAHIGL